MSKSFTPFQPSQSGSPAATIYTHPDDVASDPKLTTPRKRALLASWISDARAVENAPALRRLDKRDDGKRPSSSPRRRSTISRWLSRGGSPNSSNDNDDDPPPAPAGFGIPFRPAFVAAHGACAEKLRMRYRVNWVPASLWCRNERPLNTHSRFLPLKSARRNRVSSGATISLPAPKRSAAPACFVL